MVEGFITNQEKLEFKQIVLQHLKKILEISTNEFRGGYTITVGYNPSREEYVPDMRKCYIQAVESLADVLLPHFDKEMREAERKYREQVDKAYAESRKKYDEVPNDYTHKADRTTIELDFVIDKRGFARELFRNLNLLLKRRDYLNKAIFTEEEEPSPIDVDVIK